MKILPVLILICVICLGMVLYNICKGYSRRCVIYGGVQMGTAERDTLWANLQAFIGKGDGQWNGSSWFKYMTSPAGKATPEVQKFKRIGKFKNCNRFSDISKDDCNKMVQLMSTAAGMDKLTIKKDKSAWDKFMAAINTIDPGGVVRPLPTAGLPNLKSPPKWDRYAGTINFEISNLDNIPHATSVLVRWIDPTTDRPLTHGADEYRAPFTPELVYVPDTAASVLMETKGVNVDGFFKLGAWDKGPTVATPAQYPPTNGVPGLGLDWVEGGRTLKLEYESMGTIKYGHSLEVAVTNSNGIELRNILDERRIFGVKEGIPDTPDKWKIPSGNTVIYVMTIAKNFSEVPSTKWTSIEVQLNSGGGVTRLDTSMGAWKETAPGIWTKTTQPPPPPQQQQQQQQEEKIKQQQEELKYWKSRQEMLRKKQEIQKELEEAEKQAQIKKEEAEKQVKIETEQEEERKYEMEVNSMPPMMQIDEIIQKEFLKGNPTSEEAVEMIKMIDAVIGNVTEKDLDFLSDKGKRSVDKVYDVREDKLEILKDNIIDRFRLNRPKSKARK